MHVFDIQRSSKHLLQKTLYPFYTCILPIVIGIIAIESSGLSRKKINTYLHNHFDDAAPPSSSSSSTYLELTPLSE